MIRKFLLFFISIQFLSEQPLWAHFDVGETREYGNITVTSWWGFSGQEERNKGFIIAQYAELLAKEMGYQKNIYLNFDYSYLDKECKQYRVNCGDDSSDKNGRIHISQRSSCYDLWQTLQLVEYAIEHEDFIRNHQRDTLIPLSYDEKQTKKLVKLDDAIVNKVFQQPISERIIQVAKHKIYRPEKDESNANLSYYMQNGRFYVFTKNEGVLMEVDHIYQFYSNQGQAIVFDTDSSFYSIARISNRFPGIYTISQRQIIPETQGNYIPYQVAEIGVNKVMICMDKSKSNKPDERTMVYRLEDDRLFMNLDHLLDGHEEVRDPKSNPRVYLDTLFQKYPELIPSGYLYFLRKRYPALRSVPQNKFSQIDSLCLENKYLLKRAVYTNIPYRIDTTRQQANHDDSLFATYSPFQPTQRDVLRNGYQQGKILKKYAGKQLQELPEEERNEWLLALAVKAVIIYATPYYRLGEESSQPRIEYKKVNKKDIPLTERKRCEGRHFYQIRFGYDPTLEEFGRTQGNKRRIEDDYITEVCIWADSGEIWQVAAGKCKYIVDLIKDPKKMSPIPYCDAYIKDQTTREKFIVDIWEFSRNNHKSAARDRASYIQLYTNH